jgi:DNA modification methylase
MGNPKRGEPGRSGRPGSGGGHATWRSRIVGSADVPPADLAPNPANWRVHPSEQRAALVAALDEVGWVAHVTVNRRTGRILDGHLRRDEAEARGEATVPVVYVDLSEEEERLVLASLDPIAAMAEAEDAQLRALLDGLEPADEGLRAMLDDLGRAHGLDALLPALDVPDDVLPLPEEPYVEPGDLFHLGDHHLLCGDATNPDDVSRLLDGAKPKLLVTDPPYGVELDLAWRDEVTKSTARSKGHRNTSLAGDGKVDWSEGFALVPSLTVGYVWHAGVHAAEVAEGLVRIGFDVVSQIIWDKGQWPLSRGWYHWRHEPAWVVRRKKAKVPYLGSRDQSTIWEAPSPKRSSEEDEQDHPTQKPVLLYERPIRNHTRKGDQIYDPFAGSGTAIIAAERAGRRAYAMDIDPRYVQIAKERWETQTGKTAEKVDA